MEKHHHIVQKCYDTVANEYAKQFSNEFKNKPMDREMINRFIDTVDPGVIGDFGCGPGEITAFLHNSGKKVIGVDLSKNLLSQAQILHPGVEFKHGNILDLNFRDNSFAGIIAFYSIVHFSVDDLKKCFQEMKRVLKPNGLVLFTFHIGNETIHLNEFLGKKISIDFIFFKSNNIFQYLKEVGFNSINIIERDPYAEIEHQSRRAYVFARKPRENK